jgi:hypothetical protein
VHGNRLKRLSLEDRLEIQDLVVSYARLLDLRQFDELAGLFAVGGVLELPDKKLHGVERIKAHFQAASAQWRPKDRLHHVDSVWVCSCDWDCAVRSHYFETGWSSVRDEPVLLTSGVFEDLIVHNDGVWKFSSRKFESLDPSSRAPASGLTR